MRAQVIKTFGSPDVFITEEVKKPELKAGHVIIRVMATSVNPIDCKIRQGSVPAVAPEFPAILHGDVAGVVEEVSVDVKNFQVGDEVYAYAGGVRGVSGALAEYMLVDTQLLAKKSSNLSMAEAAALPVVAITAWRALFEKAQLQAENTVLIHGGVGGVGHIALQLARWRGAKVYTTVRSETDVAVAQSLGANEVINSSVETPEQYVKRLTGGRGFDIVFDTVGGANLDNSFFAAAQNGIVVATAARSTHDLTPLHNKGLSLHLVFVLLPLLTNYGRSSYGEILSAITTIANAGLIKPLLDPHYFTFEQVNEAHALMESGKGKGKIVLSR